MNASLVRAVGGSAYPRKLLHGSSPGHPIQKIKAHTPTHAPARFVCTQSAWNPEVPLNSVHARFQTPCRDKSLNHQTICKVHPLKRPCKLIQVPHISHRSSTAWNKDWPWFTMMQSRRIAEILNMLLKYLAPSLVLGRNLDKVAFRITKLYYVYTVYSYKTKQFRRMPSTVFSAACQKTTNRAEGLNNHGFSAFRA